MSFSTSFSSTSNYHGVNNPFLKQNTPRPGSTGGHHTDNLQQQHVDTFRLEIRVFPPPGKAGSGNNSMMNHASDPNTTLNNIKKVMQSITSTYPQLSIHSINGDTYFDHTMASYPDGRAAIDFFNFDSSELNARGFGHVSAFVKAFSHKTLHPALTDAAEIRTSPVNIALRATRASLRPHIFESFETTSIGIVLFRHLKNTHRTSAATSLHKALTEHGQKLTTTPVTTPKFELTIRESIHSPPGQQRIKLLHLNILCDKAQADTLSRMLQHAEVASHHGKFIPHHSTNTAQFYHTMHEHITFLDNLSTFSVSGLHQEVLSSIITSDQTTPPTALQAMLMDHPYNNASPPHHIMLIDEARHGGKAGQWYFSAPAVSIQSAMDYAELIFKTYAPTSENYQYHLHNSADYHNGIETEMGRPTPATPNRTPRFTEPTATAPFHPKPQPTILRTSGKYGTADHQKPNTDNPNQTRDQLQPQNPFIRHDTATTPTTPYHQNPNDHPHRYNTATKYNSTNPSSILFADQPEYVPDTAAWTETNTQREHKVGTNTTTLPFFSHNPTFPTPRHNPFTRSTEEPEHQPQAFPLNTPTKATTYNPFQNPSGASAITISTSTEQSNSSSVTGTATSEVSDLKKQLAVAAEAHKNSIMAKLTTISSLEFQLADEKARHIRAMAGAMADFQDHLEETTSKYKQQIETINSTHKQEREATQIETQQLRDRANQSSAASKEHMDQSKTQSNKLQQTAADLRECIAAKTTIENQYTTLQDSYDSALAAHRIVIETLQQELTHTKQLLSEANTTIQASKPTATGQLKQPSTNPNSPSPRDAPGHIVNTSAPPEPVKAKAPGRPPKSRQSTMSTFCSQTARPPTTPATLATSTSRTTRSSPSPATQHKAKQATETALTTTTQHTDTAGNQTTTTSTGRKRKTR